MTLLAGSVIAVLLALAALHLYWGFGGFWPGRDGPTLAERVAGWKSKRPASLASCAAVALALAASALIVAVQQDAAPRFGNWDGLWTLGYWVVFGVFLLRGLAAYTPAFAYAKGTPFYTLNRRYYGPLCIAIAAAMAIAQIGGTA